ncbi:MAG TPA: hypothetical protein VLH41_08100, partial [Thermoanaerobaculia bacterium]|nr:hypothetical protein [Thermoanaerobaculia bacterium]
AGLGVLANRPFNAISPQGMVRFAPLAGDVLRSLGGSADREAARIARLDAHLTATFGDVGRGTTSQRTLRALLTVPGVDVVLVGMRRPEYVDDVLGAFF